MINVLLIFHRTLLISPFVAICLHIFWQLLQKNHENNKQQLTFPFESATQQHLQKLCLQRAHEGLWIASASGTKRRVTALIDPGFLPSVRCRYDSARRQPGDRWLCDMELLTWPVHLHTSPFHTTHAP